MELTGQEKELIAVGVIFFLIGFFTAIFNINLGDYL